MARPTTDLGDHVHAVGAAVQARREALGYSRAEFARLWPRISYRMLQDLENGRRQTFSDEVIAKLELKLRWERGSLARIADGEEPIELPPDELVETRHEHGVERRAYAAGAAEIVQHIARDVAEDIGDDDDLSDDEAAELLERALEQARSQALLLVHMERERRRRGREKTEKEGGRQGE